ncbi:MULTISPECIES: type VI secretion system protein TssA [Pseudomonas]|uniref:type VI secretion system protein TssA n=1 Tax=Pseudomonas TaxID=286 RepID=UPI002185F9A5|nr:type VI secretion system protein TssA [Pseudomonas sp. LRP2-20]BDM22741.1 type VI secretion system protein TssA [Pseudomonas sp. LRP2-20]
MHDILDDLSLSALRTPIDGGAGEDLSFSSLFDQIKEARRADPEYLTQGDWQTDLKQADWEQVIQLAAAGLTEQSKDLMLVAWLSEGLAHRKQFPGIRFSLAVAQALLEDFWDTLYPSLDEGVDERATRLAWLTTTLTEVVRTLPITQGQGYSLLKYEESRQVENLARQNPSAMHQALEEGKINAELFQRSVVLTDTEHLHTRYAQISECLAACQQLQATADAAFASDAPSFLALNDVLVRARQLVERLLKERGVELAQASGASAEETAQPERPAAAAGTVPAAVQRGDNAPLRTVPLNREEAFTLLQGVAQFFKQTEPHSPVPYLVERAIKWGNMPLESWLNDVIKDSSVVDGIRDVLGTLQPRD